VLAEQGMSIACTRCEADNPPGARFCMRCGAALPVRCPHCGALLPPDARFCTQCGQPVRAGAAQPDEAPSAGERRLATVVMADVKGSTALAERIDTETWVEIMHGVFQVLDVEVYRYGGQIDQYRGDGLVAFFGVPIAHEDDPERAVRAALAMQEAIERYAAAVEEKHRTQGDPITLQLRIGVNTGEVVVASVGDRRWHTEDTAMGRAVALAARMETAAAPGTVLVTEHTYRLVAPLFEWEALGQTAVKGVSQPLSVYRPLAAKAVAGKIRGIEGLESPIVGRDAEIRALEGAIARLQSGMGGIVTVVGDAGIGKSRLVAEIRKHNLAKHTIGNKSRINLHVNKVY
jgi:class 3 adenylate cyclase